MLGYASPLKPFDRPKNQTKDECFERYLYAFGWRLGIISYHFPWGPLPARALLDPTVIEEYLANPTRESFSMSL